jgi:hypothetical protein
MKNLKPIACAAVLAMTLSAPTFAKTGTISTTKTGTISTTRTGTISTTATASSNGRTGTISTTRTGTISTTRVTSIAGAERALFVELLFSVFGLW